MLILYSAAIFVSAVLLFSLEPMVGKMLLPRCGGTPAVWNTCMVFFQAVLLLGYAYAHLSTSLLGVRRQAAFHLAVILLPLMVLPVQFAAGAGPPVDGNPSVWLLIQLTLAVGLPFFVISATAPLLQRWFARMGRAGSSDPYFLYSTSNAGSLIALLSYPFLIEPRMGLLTQTRVWTAAYVLLAVLMLGCAAAMWLASRRAAEGDNPLFAAKQSRHSLDAEGGSPLFAAQKMGPSPSLWRQRLYWVLLAFIPSSLMLGVTTYMVTDIASAPLLWVIPLGLYLLTFVIVFARRPILPHSLFVVAMPYAVLVMPLFFIPFAVKIWISIPAHLLTFFLVAMVCHGELARSRPGAQRLTEFYLWMGLGGVLGGMFNALAAPLIFPWLVEYPLMLVAACFFRPASRGGAKRTEFNLRDLEWLLGLIAVTMLLMGLSALFFTSDSLLLSSLLYAVPALICFGFRKRPLRFALGVTVLFLTVACYVSALFGDVLLTERNFYGMKRVSRVEDQYHSLVNGNIVHGIQKMRPRPSSDPLGYYCRSGPLGDLTCAFDRSKEKGRVAVVGLGTGSIASYARPGQHYTFYEIDPAVIRIAKDPKLFMYLTECRGAWDVVEGDARLRMAEAPDGEFHAIILDAFSSDSIPMHLLTQEALQLYCRKLKADGVLVFHISNRYLNLEPVLAALAEKNHLVCFSRADLQVPEEERRKKKYPSHYLVMARHLSDLGDLSKNSRWSRPKPLAGAQEWTDDYSNILSVLDW